MKRVKKLLYGIEDYARDRLNQGANYVKGAVNEGIESVQGAFNQGADYIQGLLGGNQQSGQSTPASVQMAQKPTSTPVQVQTPTVTQPTTPTVTQPTGVNPLEANANATKPLTQVDIARNQMEQARQKVYDVLNTKFQYNAKASPLYSILDRQYEEQARKAAGEAYARSVANTGGYGSSYATNTAAEARRQVMEGFNDQQYALYQAAKDEFLTERQSAVDWYNMSKQIYNDVQDEALMSAYESAYNVWDGTNDDAVRAALTEQGVSATNINKIMTALKQEKLSNLQTDSSISQIQDNAAYKSAYRSASALWTGDNESEVRTALLASGVDAGTINSIIRELKTGTRDDLTLNAELEGLKQSTAYRTAEATARSIWASNKSESAVRSALSGYSATIVDAIVQQLKQEQLGDMATDADIDALKETSAYKTALNEAYTLQNQNKTLAEIETELNKTYSAAMVKQIIMDLKSTANTDKGLDVESNQLDATLEEGRKNREYNALLDTAYSLLFSGTSLEELQSKLTGNSQAIAAVMNDIKAYVAQQGSLDATISNQQRTAAKNAAKAKAAELWANGKSTEEIKASLLESNVPADIVQEVLSEQLGYQVDTTQKEAVLKQFADDQAATDAYNAIYDKWQSPADTDASVAELQAQGYDGITINKVLKAMKADYYTNLETDAAIRDLVNDQNMLDAYNAALTVWTTNQDEAAVRDALSAYSPAIVEDVVSLLNNSALQSAETKAALQELATNDALRKAYNEACEVWQNGNDEAAVREALKGYEAVIVEDTVSMLKAGKLSNMQIDAQIKELERTESGELTEEAERDLYNSAAAIYNGENKDQVETMLKNDGASDEEAAKIINSLEAVERAGLSDAAKNVTDIASAVDFKAQLDAARRNNTLSVAEYDEWVKINSGKIVSGINENINDMESIDYEGLGISEDEWNNMDDVDKKLAVFDAVGQMAQEGVVTRSDYYKMLYNDTKEYFASEDYKKSKTQTRDTIDRAIIIQDLFDAGNLPTDDYTSLLYQEIVPKMNTAVVNALVKVAKKNYEATGEGVNVQSASLLSQRDLTIKATLYNKLDRDNWQACTEEQKEMLVIVANFLAQRGESTTNKPTTPNPSLASSPTTRTTLDS